MSDSETENANPANKYNEEDAFKILVATDIHLGYNEKDVIRGLFNFVLILLNIILKKY